MATTDNLLITKIAVGQSQKETTMNEALDDLDMAITDVLGKSVAGGSDVTLTATESLSMVQEYTGTLTANINVIVPTYNKVWIINNISDGAFTLCVKTSAGTGVYVTQGSMAILYCDGTHVVRVTPDQAADKGLSVSDSFVLDESVTLSIA